MMVIFHPCSNGILNAAELSRSSSLPQTTLSRYLRILETIFIFEPLPAWSSNRGKRLVKAPKIHFADSGLAAYLAGTDEAKARSDGLAFGPLLETFVVGELRKQLSWSDIRATLRHYRSNTGAEVDAVLEAADGRVVGVEIKAAASVKPQDFRGLRALADDCGGCFVRGVILYDGKETVIFNESMAAVPFAALWGKSGLMPG